MTSVWVCFSINRSGARSARTTPQHSSGSRPSGVGSGGWSADTHAHTNTHTLKKLYDILLRCRFTSSVTSYSKDQVNASRQHYTWENKAPDGHIWFNQIFFFLNCFQLKEIFSSFLPRQCAGKLVIGMDTLTVFGLLLLCVLCVPPWLRGLLDRRGSQCDNFCTFCTNQSSRTFVL